MRDFIVMGVAVLGCVSPAVADELRIGGTGAGLALSQALGDAFKQQHPGVEIWIPESLGTSGGIKALAAGKLDLAVTARSLKAGEVENGESVALCRTPWVFFAHASRTDVGLTQADVVKLFDASLAPFSQGEVRPLLRPANESGFIYLEKVVPGLSQAIETARQNRGAVLAMTDQEAMSMVEVGPSLVGFGAMAPVLAEQRRLRVVPLDGLDPVRLSPDYPYWADLYMAAGPGSSALARAFLDFLATETAAEVLRRNGCLPGDGKRS